MSIIVGIDEAGYGPPLGPLVVSAVVFRVPAEHRDANLWKLLGKYVSDKARGRQKLIVADSKKSYTRSKGVGVLEETTLCFLALSGKRFDRMDQLLTALAGDDANDALNYPWYRPQEHSVPVSGRGLGIDAKSERLRETLSEAGVEFIGAWCLPLFEAAFNRAVDETGNKQTVLFAQASRLIGGMMKRFAKEDLMIHVDKQGGRDRYGPLLGMRFKGTRVVVKQQDRHVGHYHLRRKGSECEVRFMMHGEKHSMPVALASMYSKYVRELYMQLFNHYWAQQLPGVKPTAGYAEDSKRFLAEIASVRARIGIPDDALIRKK